MINIEKVNRLLGFDIHDGSITEVSWIEDRLKFTILGCGEYKVTLCFHGVQWIRTLCDEAHDGFAEGSRFEEYPLISRDELNADYTEFVCYGLLDGVRVLGEGIICFDDIFFFDCTDVTVIE